MGNLAADLGLFEHREQPIPEASSVGQGVERHGELRRAGNAEEGGGRPGRDHQVVVVNLRTVTERDEISCLIDAAHATVTKSHVRGVAENRANRKGHVGRLKTGRRHLIQQWQERVEVVLVDNGDPNVLMGQALGSGDAAESPTDNDDVGQRREVPRNGAGGNRHVRASIMKGRITPLRVREATPESVDEAGDDHQYGE